MLGHLHSTSALHWVPPSYQSLLPDYLSYLGHPLSNTSPVLIPAVFTSTQVILLPSWPFTSSHSPPDGLSPPPHHHDTVKSLLGPAISSSRWTTTSCSPAHSCPHPTLPAAHLCWDLSSARANPHLFSFPFLTIVSIITS